MSEIINRKLKELTKLENNPRKIQDFSLQQLCESIERNPDYFAARPLILSNRTGKLVIIAGNQRFEAAKKLKYTEVPTFLLENLTIEREREIALRDNVNSGEWDFDILKTDWFDLPLADFGVPVPDDWAEIVAPEFTASTEEQQTQLQQELTRIDEQGEQIANRLDELQEKYRTAASQVWQLGDHRVICGDSTNAETVARLMNGETGEILFTSPPYLDQRTYETEADLSGENINKFIEIFAPLVKFQILNLGIIRRNHEIVTYWNDFIAKAQGSGLKLLSWNVWDKLTPGGVAQQTAMFGIEHEFIFVFGKTPKKLNRTVPNQCAGETQDVLSKREQNGTLTKTKTDYEILPFRQLGTVYRGTRMTVSQNMFDHPAPFPVHFPFAYIEAMTDQNDVVCEPFLGSGTTLIACEKLKRRCFGIELSAKYLGGTLERFRALTGVEPKLLET